MTFQHKAATDVLHEVTRIPRATLYREAFDLLLEKHRDALRSHRKEIERRAAEFAKAARVRADRRLKESRK